MDNKGFMHVMDFGHHFLVELSKKLIMPSTGQVIFSADGKKLYARTTGGGGTGISGAIKIFDNTSSTMDEIGSIENIGYPVNLFIAGDKLLVASQGGLNNDPLYVVNTHTDKVIRRIHGFPGPISQVIATQNGDIAFVYAGGSLYCIKNYMNDSLQNIRVIPIASRIPSILSDLFPELKSDTVRLQQYSNITTLSFSALALTPNDKTLLIGTSMSYSYKIKDTIRNALRDTSIFLGGAVISFDVETHTFCNNNAMPLEAAPEVMVIAKNGTLYAPLPKRVLTGDAYAMSCNKHSP